ncbi:hypothetical protein M885DRAFT_524019 [Pelagophyceae sp. CCMP2097]|nr:hypothetical protein M885DRAFT_524019 [Pelagophyceae sp. CCMP2097]|mmetsp:Transcript_5358/g.16946  ORF Transcript_5358/g.16946 Transcript_5358/m.16946 type:complete len:414 (-) Transcript_5358:861-2102(-)
MSLSFLSKKTWHTSNIGNVEKVWLAEQTHDREAKKLKELQKQIDEERQIDELRGMQKDAGLVTDPKSKVEWMYEGPGSAIASNAAADAYKLGKEYLPTAQTTQLNALEDKSTAGSTWLDNKANDTNEQFARLNNDPLYLMRQSQKREREKSVLQNPLQMKRIKQTLVDELRVLEQMKGKKSEHKAAKAVKKANKQAKKEAKKDAKKKKKHKKGSSSDDSDDGRTAAPRDRRDDRRSDARDDPPPRAEEAASKRDEAASFDAKKTYGLAKGKRDASDSRNDAALGPSASLLQAREREEELRGRAAAPRQKQKLSDEEIEKRRREMAQDGTAHDAQRYERMKDHRQSDVKDAISADDAAKQRSALVDNEKARADPKFLRTARNEVYGEGSNMDLQEALQRNKNRHQKAKNRDTFM